MAFILIGLFKIDAYAYEYKSGKCGNNLTYTITGDNERNLTLTISGTGPMWDYGEGCEAGYSSPWQYKNSIKTIVLEEGLTSIGSRAFVDDSPRDYYSWGFYPATISFPSTLESIGDYAFAGSCIYGNLVIPEGATYVGEHAFYNCQGLNGYISLPDSLSMIGAYAFRNCKKLTGTLELPSKLKNISAYAFYNMDGINTFIIGENTTFIGEYAFADNGKMTTVKIPSKVATIDQYAFYKSPLEGTVNIPKSVQQIKTAAFKGTKLDTIRFLGNAPTENEDAFDKSKVTIIFPKNAQGFSYFTWHGYKSDWYGRIKVENISIYPKNTEIMLGKTVTVKVTVSPSNADIKDINWTINGYSQSFKSTSFTFKPESEGTYKIQAVSEDGGYIASTTIIVYEPQKGAKLTKGKTTYVVTSPVNMTVRYAGTTDKNATTVSIPNYITYGGLIYYVTEIGPKALKGNKKVKTVKMGQNITKIGDEAFSGCAALKTVTIGSEVKKVGDKAFYNCKKLTKLKVGTNVTSFGDYALYGCAALKELTLPVKTSKLGERFIENCKNLKTFTIKCSNITSNTLDSQAFKGSGTKVVIKVPKKKVDAYTKLFRKKGLSKSVKIKAIK